MINVLSSKADKANPSFKSSGRKPGEDNLAWLKRNLDGSGDQANMLLVGGTGRIDFRLRVAQAHVRHDLLPSYWSHAMLLKPAGGKKSPDKVYEISLEPATGFGFPTPDNALQVGDLARYKNAKDYPNIAIITFPIAFSVLKVPLDRFRKQRASLDALELVLHWLGFAWGVGKQGNPLLEGYGIPSSAMLEVVLGAAGLDLTPGLESRSSCPEAIWQATKWWHEYYEAQNKSAPYGVYSAEHELN